MMEQTRRRVAGCLLVALLTVAVFARTVTFDFVNFDDIDYVYENAAVTAGLTAAGVRYAFTDLTSGNWHPLTWLSHMLDAQLFGLRPGAHHLVNVLIHALAAAGLFLFLELGTGAFGPSLFAALVFAIHPLRVQSVAWVSERKDVLAALFWVACLLLYLAWVRRPRPAAMGALCAAFALGLMAKPMLVTLPIVLLLLDAWPLGRFGRVPLSRLLAEKVPLSLLAAASAVVATIAQREGEALRNLQGLPLGHRSANALTSVVAYLGKTLWPADLAVFYPLARTPIPAWRWAGAAGIILGLTLLAAWQWRRRPFLAAGWLWYLIALLPVIGLVQVGDQSMADRYTYLPTVGLLLMLTWGAAGLVRRGVLAPRAAVATGIAVVAVLSLATLRELSYWRGTIPLMERALAVTTDNYVAENNLGSALLDAGRMTEAIPHFQAAIRLRSGHANAHYNLGVALLTLSRWAEAAEHFRIALHVTPDDTDALLNLGAAYLNLERNAEAASLLERALVLKPGYRMAEENLATARKRLGSTTVPPAASIIHRDGVGKTAESQIRTGMGLLEQGEAVRAIRHFEAALELQPGHPDALRGLAAARDIAALQERSRRR